MGKVSQKSGGGGRVSVKNLSPENIRKGAVVTVKQGGKTILTVTGTLLVL